MFGFNKKKEETEEMIENENTPENKNISNEIYNEIGEVEEEPKDERIWVEGYIKIDKDKKIILNKEYKLNKTILSNFHDTTVPELDIKYKIFKVKGLINKKEIDKYKYSTKSIVFIKEFTYQDLIKYINRDLKFIENEEEYNNCFDYDKLRKEKYTKQMIKLGFTELFVRVIYNKVIKSTYINCYGYIGNEEQDNCIINFLDKAKAYKEENISKDILIYLLLEELK